MLLTNPKIDGRIAPLTTLLTNLPKSISGTYKFAGTIPLPDWRGVNNHFQGIAPINGYTWITGNISASAHYWWRASFEAIGNPGLVTAVVSTTDVTTMRAPVLKYEIHVAFKTSAAAITSYTDSLGVDQSLILIYRYDPKKFYVYRTANVSMDQNNWSYIGETNEIPDPDQREPFQCFALCTESNAGHDTVYLLGFRENVSSPWTSVRRTTAGSRMSARTKASKARSGATAWDCRSAARR